MYQLLNFGQVCDVIAAPSWKAALDVAIRRYGDGAWVVEVK